MAPPIIAAVIGLAGSAFSAKMASDDAKDAQEAQEKARREAEEEARRIAAETKPEGLKNSVEFGSEDKNTEAGSTSDFLSPLEMGSAGLTTGTGQQTAGLGFSSVLLGLVTFTYSIGSVQWF